MNELIYSVHFESRCREFSFDFDDATEAARFLVNAALHLNPNRSDSVTISLRVKNTKEVEQEND